MNRADLELLYGPAIRPDGEHNEKVCARMDPDPDACVAPACAIEKRKLLLEDLERCRAGEWPVRAQDALRHAEDVMGHWHRRALAAEALAERSRALLKRIEWEARGWAGVDYCHLCGGYRFEGHRSGCELASLIGG